MKYLIVLFLSLVCAIGNAQSTKEIPADLLYLGKPIDPLCFFSSENSNLVKLKECGIQKEKYTRNGQDQDLIKKGYIGYNWKDTAENFSSQGLSYYKIFDQGNKQYWVYSINNSGGSGYFTALSLVKRKTPETLEINTIASGDRCNGGIQDVENQNNHLTFSVNVTAFDFFDLARKNPHHIKAYDDLAACAACCAAKAFYKINSDLRLKFNYVDLGTDINLEEMSTQGKYQGCFNHLFIEYVKKKKNKLNEAELQQFVNEFNKKCIR